MSGCYGTKRRFRAAEPCLEKSIEASTTTRESSGEKMKKPFLLACVLGVSLWMWVGGVVDLPLLLADENSTPEVPQNYVIGQGDLLEIFVWRNDQLSRDVVVMPDGRISLPLIHQVQASGLTISELENRVREKLSTYVENPRVTVIVKELNSFRVSVLGNVVKPGVYPITGKTTVIEAIGLAGGLNEWARRGGITVIRNEQGKEKRIKVNYNKVVSGKDLSQNIVLERGDTIIVP